MAPSSFFFFELPRLGRGLALMFAGSLNRVSSLQSIPSPAAGLCVKYCFGTQNGLCFECRIRSLPKWLVCMSASSTPRMCRVHASPNTQHRLRCSRTSVCEKKVEIGYRKQ
jgi:hypothetical protein